MRDGDSSGLSGLKDELPDRTAATCSRFERSVVAR